MFAALVTACSSGEGVPSPTPTGPTPVTPPVSSPAPSPSPAPSCLPGAPSNLRVSTVGSSRTFTWNAVSNAVDYFIQIGTETGRSDLVSTNTSQTTYTWTGNSPGTYFSRVYARNSCGSGNSSTEIVFN